MSLRSLLPALFVSATLAAQPAPFVHDSPESGATYDGKALAKAGEVIERLVAAGEVLGAVVLVAQGRVILLSESFGHRDVARTQPMATTTLFRMASNTKAVTAAAVLSLVDAGAIALDDPVARFLPGFANGESAKITVRHLLTHTSGLRIESLFVRPLMKPSEEHPDAPNLVLEASRFGEIGPREEPGATYAYSNPGYNALAAIVEVVTKVPFAEYVQHRFYDRLAMQRSCHHEAVADNDLMAAVVKKGKGGAWVTVWQPGDAATVPFVRGSGGMISTAGDFAHFCRLWLDDGMVGEQRLLSSEVVRAATTNRIEHIQGRRYGFGWVIGADGVFSHSGSDGTWAMCDPARDLVVLVFTQTQESEALAQGRRVFAAAVRAACPPGPPQERR